jgi:hypothetical protein
MINYVVYVGNGHNHFTYGKKYRVLSRSGIFINIIDDIGGSLYGPIKYFITVEECRDRKLKELL